MAIVLNEYEWAERAILSRTLGPKPGETLSRVAKYYYENKYSKKEVRKLLDQFLMQCDPDASLFFWSDTLDRIVKNAARYPLIQIDCIYINPDELSKIETLKSTMMRKLAFTILCVSKYWNLVSENNNNWLNTPDKEIFKMANLVVPPRKQDTMYGELRNAGFIRFSKRIDNLNVQVLFGSESDAEGGIYVRDFRNLGYQYQKHYDDSFFECENCGLTIKMNSRTARGAHKNGSTQGRHRKYCASCASEIKTRQSVNAVMRHRDVVV